MAKETLSQAINYDITATLKSMGFRGGAKEVAGVKAEFQKLDKSLGDAIKRVSIATKAFAQNQKEAHKFSRSIKRGTTEVVKLGKSANTLTSSLTSVAKSLIFAGATGYKFFDTLRELDQMYLKISASAGVYNVSLQELETFSKNAINTMGLTRKEAVSFFETFSKGFIGEDMTGAAEKIGANIKNVVGPNVDAFNKMQGAINEVLIQMPSLSNAFLDMSNPDSIKRIKQHVDFMHLIGKMSDDAAVQITAYYKQDKIGGEEMQEREKVWQQLKEHSIMIAEKMGKAFIPIIKEISSWFVDAQGIETEFFKSLQKGVQKVVPYLKDIIVAFGIFKGVIIAIKGVQFALLLKGWGGAIVGVVKALGPLGVAIAAGVVLGKQLAKVWEWLAEKVGWVEKGFKKMGEVLMWLADNVPGLDLVMGIDTKEAKKSMKENEEFYKKNKERRSKMTDAEKKAEADVYNASKEAEKKAHQVRLKTNEAKGKGNKEDQKAGKLSEQQQRVLDKLELTRIRELLPQRLSGLEKEIKLQQLSGNINIQVVRQNKEKVITSLNASKQLEENALKLAKENLQLSIKNGESIATQNFYKSQMVDLSNKILDIDAQMLTVRIKTADVWDTQIAIAGQEASIAKQLVTLADNFAIGVGASAQMRMKAVGAIDREIYKMKQKEKELKRELALNQNNAEARKKLLTLQGQMLSKQTEQASMLKTLRDGWVSAIGAMNTGAGRYTKIIMNAQKNTAAMIKMSGVISSYSGSYSGGYTGSAKFGLGGVRAARGGVGGGLAYESHGGREAQMLESMMRGDISGVMGGLRERVGEVNMGGFAAQGSKYYAGAMAEAGTGNMGRYWNEQGMKIGTGIMDGIMKIVSNFSPDAEGRVEQYLMQ